MNLVVDEDHLGPSERQWASSGRLASIALLSAVVARRVVVLAPHPDDEVFGAGGLLQSLSLRDIPVEVIFATDGEASHPLATATYGIDLRSIRASESETALRRLGVDPVLITRLGIPDGQVGDHIDRLLAALVPKLRPDDLCLAPWRYDGHPDHDACGEAALVASRSTPAQLLGYLVWAWHWADPHGSDVPWNQSRRFVISRRMAARKRWASRAFVSQTRPLGGGEPILPAPLLRRFWRPYEVFVDPADQTR